MTLPKIFKQTNHDHNLDECDLKMSSTILPEEYEPVSSPVDNELHQKEPALMTKRLSSLRAVRTIMKHAPKAMSTPNLSSDNKASSPSIMTRRRIKKSILLRNISGESSSTLDSIESEGSAEDEEDEQEEDPILSLVGNRKRRIRRPCRSGMPQIQIGAIVGESTIVEKHAHCTESSDPAVVTTALQSSEAANDMLVDLIGTGPAKAEEPKKNKLMIVKDMMYCARIILFPLRILYRKKPDIVEFKRAKGRLV